MPKAKNLQDCKAAKLLKDGKTAKAYAVVTFAQAKAVASFNVSTRAEYCLLKLDSLEYWQDEYAKAFTKENKANDTAKKHLTLAAAKMTDAEFEAQIEALRAARAAKNPAIEKPQGQN